MSGRRKCAPVGQTYPELSPLPEWHVPHLRYRWHNPTTDLSPVAPCQVAEHIQQAARLVEEARGARQAGLARERQLAAEVEGLRAQEALRVQRLRDAAAGSQEPLARLQQQVGLVSVWQRGMVGLAAH